MSSALFECPECKGSGTWLDVRHAQMCGAFVDDEENHHFHHANCYEQEKTCGTCLGRGQIGSVQMAVYRARGGPAPTQLRGFA